MGPNRRLGAAETRTLRITHGRRGVDSILAALLVAVVTLVASLAVSGFVFGVLGHAQDSAQVLVTGVNFKAGDFLQTGTTATFTCSTSSAGSFVSVTNAGTGTAEVTGVLLNWAGTSTAYSVSGPCSIGGAGSSTMMYLIFPATTKLVPGGVAGDEFSGTVNLSNGAQILLASSWE